MMCKYLYLPLHLFSLNWRSRIFFLKYQEKRCASERLVAQLFYERYVRFSPPRLSYKPLFTVLCKCRHYNNAFYARVGGVSNAELNKLEVELLFLLDFGVMVSSRVFESYCFHLEKENMQNGACQRIERPLLVLNGAEDVPEISENTESSSSPPQISEVTQSSSLPRTVDGPWWFYLFSIAHG